MSPISPSRPPGPCPTIDQLTHCLDSHFEPDRQLCQHLEQCAECQQALQQITAESSWWAETQQQLSRPPEPRALRISQPICALATGSPRHGAGTELADHETEHLRRLLAAPSHPELLGRIGRYELEQLVGRGGMGLVFRARDTELHRVVAVKILALAIVDHPEARQRFIREARVSAALVHPHIVPVHDVITDGPLPALVMQFIAGTTLEQRLQVQGAVAWREAMLIGLQLAEALAMAHRHGLVHRDIKPGNVMLEGDGTRAMLTDFGLVRALDAATLTRSGVLAGTPDYMSPEQARGVAVDERSDLFSLGTLLYTMIAGQPPFRADDPMATLNRICHKQHVSLLSLVPDLPRRVSRLVDQLLTKDPGKRIGSAEEVAERLQQLLRPPSWQQTRWFRQTSSSPAVLARAGIARHWLVMVSLCVLVLLAGVYWQMASLQQQQQVLMKQVSRAPRQTSPTAPPPYYVQPAPVPISQPPGTGHLPQAGSPPAVPESLDTRIDQLKLRLAMAEQDAVPSREIGYEGEKIVAGGRDLEMRALHQRLEQLERELVPASHK